MESQFLLQKIVISKLIMLFIQKYFFVNLVSIYLWKIKLNILDITLKLCLMKTSYNSDKSSD